MSINSLIYNSVQIQYEQNELKSQFDSGRVIARKKFSNTRRNITATLPPLSLLDLQILASHFGSVGTVDIFQFQNPDTLEVINVRFSSPLSYSKSSRIKDRYAVESLQMQEVI